MPSGAPGWVADFYDRKGLVSGPSGCLSITGKEPHPSSGSGAETQGGSSSSVPVQAGAPSRPPNGAMRWWLWS